MGPDKLATDARLVSAGSRIVKVTDPSTAVLHPQINNLAAVYDPEQH
jgi:hypothetical protein